MLRYAGNHAIANVPLVPPSLRLMTHAPGFLPIARTLRHASSTARLTSGYPRMREINDILHVIPPLPSAARTAPRNDIDTVNMVLPILQEALADRDLVKAQQTWSTIIDKQVLRLVGRPAHERHSRLLGAICEEEIKGRAWTWTDEQRAAFADMAFVAATAGYPRSLTSLMLLNLKHNELETVHRLYTSYVMSMKDADTWLDPDGYERSFTTTFSQSSLMGEQEGEQALQKEEQPSEDTAETHEEDSDGSASSTDKPLVSPMVLLCSIAAHAVQNNFLGAIRTVLQTATRVSESQINLFSSRLPLQKELKARLVHYAHRLNVIRIVARPTSCFNHLTALVNDHAYEQLQTFYTSILSELPGDTPCLTTDPNKISDTTPVLFPDFAWGLFLKGFLLCRQLPMAGQVWDDISRYGSTPSAATWTALLQGYSHLRLGEQLLAAWKLMQEQHIMPDASMYQAVIEGLLRAKMHQEGLHCFRKFRSSLKSATLQDPSILLVHNATVNGLLLNDEEQEATAILELMNTQQPHPDIATHNMFLRHYAKKGDFKAVASVLQAVDKAKIRGDVFTFSTLLTALLKVRQEDAPQIVFDLMRKQGVKPNIVMYTGIIDHLMKQRSPTAFTAGLEVLRTLEQDTSGDVTPNIVTYTSVLTGVLRAEWLDSAAQEEVRRDITRRMTERGITPNTTTYNILMEAAFDNKDVRGAQLAMQYYREMARRMVKRDTYWVLLKGLSQRGELQLAEEVLSDMSKRKFTPQHSLASLVVQIKRRSAERGRH